MSDRYDELHDERLSALYRETREVEPPAWLDRRVLTMAGAAVGPRPAPAPKRRTIRWAVSLALVATVMLTVGVVRVVRESGESDMWLRQEAVRSLAEPAAEADATATGSAGSPAAGALQSAPQPVPATPPASRRPPTLSAERKQRESIPAEEPGEGKSAPVQNPALHRPPAEWLAEIAELRRQGRTVEAEASLAEFRRRYPDYPLDAEASPR